MTGLAQEPLTATDVRHREEFERYARNYGHAPWQGELDRLYGLWEDWNRTFFGARLVAPHILLSEPKCPQAFGDHAPVSGWGSRNQIRLRPSLLTGTHRAVRCGDAFKAGRFLLVADVLLHETVHQFLDEVAGKPERSYHGHGPAFRDECNRISQALGLSPVRTAKRRGKGKALPSCAQWPLNVRPRGYYQGAFDPGTMLETQDPADDPSSGDEESTRPDDGEDEQDSSADARWEPALAALVRAAITYGQSVPPERRTLWTTRAGAYHPGLRIRRLAEAALAVSASVAEQGVTPDRARDPYQ